MVYKLYELTYDEVKIVDPQIDEVLSSLGLTKNGYENRTIDELSNYDLTYPENFGMS